MNGNDRMFIVDVKLSESGELTLDFHPSTLQFRFTASQLDPRNYQATSENLARMIAKEFVEEVAPKIALGIVKLKGRRIIV